MTAARPYKSMAMEGAVATWYARNTGRDQRRFASIAQSILKRVPAGSSVLEVAPGPGYLAIDLAKRGNYAITGLDISESFVRIARENADKVGVAIDFQHGNASAMPLASDAFDYVVCVAAFKNFSDPVGALNEMHRVLKPGGCASIYDLRKDASLDAIAAEVRNMGLSALSSLFTRWVFRFSLLKRAYSSAEMAGLAERSRFVKADIRSDGIGFEVRLAK